MGVLRAVATWRPAGASGWDLGCRLESRMRRYLGREESLSAAVSLSGAVLLDRAALLSRALDRAGSQGGRVLTKVNLGHDVEAERPQLTDHGTIEVQEYIVSREWSARVRRAAHPFHHPSLESPLHLRPCVNMGIVDDKMYCSVDRCQLP